MPKPVSVVCYICSREFGTQSIAIHEPQCLKKWHAQNNELPKSQRRPEPVKPQLHASSNEFQPITTPSKNINYEEYNLAASEAASKGLVPCNKCGRTFNADRVDIHQRNCKITTKHEKVKTYEPYDGKDYINQLNAVKPTFGGGASAAPVASVSNQGLVQCGNCPRKFAPDRLPVHERSCKPKAGSSRGRNNFNSNANNNVDQFIAGDKSNCVTEKIKTVVCYICGREFGSKSISIHEPQCLTKWNIENNKLAPSLRRSPPTKPNSAVSLKESNELATKSFLEQLLPCPNCSRRFATDRLEVHLRSCKSDSKIQTLNKNSVTKPSKPQTLICYICSREYGSLSLSIHQPKCLAKWHIENDKLPPSQRRKEPIKPDILNSLNKSQNNNEYNEAAWKASQQNLVPCPNCQRTFNPDRVEVHLRSCKPKV